MGATDLRQAAPTRRPLKIFSSDPMLGRAAGNRITIDIPNEGSALSAGPTGERIAVVDYDGARKVFYPPVDLDDPAILVQGGLDPDESNPHFHQQMVYAVAMRTLENFDRALGRRLEFPRLRLFPHAFRGGNAYYDPEMNAVLFGYFAADRKQPGPNLPGQTVFTCLSHDIIAHEVTHALVHRLRPYFNEPTNDDVLAFHEAFADVVAIFQHFSFEELLREEMQRSHLEPEKAQVLARLARQFGYATGSGQALRSAVDEPDPRLFERLREPHERGAVIVAAIFDGFVQTYRRRIRDLVRVATGGTGKLPEGDLHPDLVKRIATEASKTAQSILTMCIRAFDYLPPVDVTFSDFLRALVTADTELVATDEYGQRGSVIEGFRRRGVYPRGVTSLAEESCRWEDAPPGLPRLPVTAPDLIGELLFSASRVGARRRAGPPPSLESESLSDDLRQQFNRTMRLAEQTVVDSSPAPEPRRPKTPPARAFARTLHAYASEHAVALGLDPAQEIAVRGFHTVFRVAPDGGLVVEIVAQLVQTDPDPKKKEDLGGVPFRGGTTLVASVDGRIRYLVSKPLPSRALGREAQRHGEERLARQRAYVDACDRDDPAIPYMGAAARKERMKERARVAAMHLEVRR